MIQATKDAIARRTLRSVVRVGDGRGFAVQGERDRLVITAAHCLPSFPPCHAASDVSDRTYEKILAPLGTEPSIWAECRFVDPIADIAVLGPPDDQAVNEQWWAYNAFTAHLSPLPIADAPTKSSVWLLSLDNTWSRCAAWHDGDAGALWLSDARAGIRGGMSGSPIVNDNGRAIGVVCVSGSSDAGPDAVHTEGGPNPRLAANLPGWLLRQLLPARSKR